MAEVVHEQDLMDSVTVQPKKRTTDSDDALDTVTLVLMRGRDPTGSIGSGVQYQRCGGGRRILKKRIGGN